jgi:hypothetical protein
MNACMYALIWCGAELSEKLLKYETATVNVARRRVFAHSQALSVGVNALLMKLAMVAEGHIPAQVAEQVRKS